MIKIIIFETNNNKPIMQFKSTANHLFILQMDWKQLFGKDKIVVTLCNNSDNILNEDFLLM